MGIVADLIQNFDPENPYFPPTEIFNENWLLKAFLYQASRIDLGDSPFSFDQGATWFSEAMLPTAFKQRFLGDPLAEFRTHADGVIGHIDIGRKGKADLELASDATQFVVIEAKIGAHLSPGTQNAPEFDQAARNVACMAEVLSKAELSPAKMERFAFVLLAPQSSIESDTFSSEMNLEGMRGKIQSRVSRFDGTLDEWYQKWAEPTLDAVALHTISWETAIRGVEAIDPQSGEALKNFYDTCLEVN